MEHLPDVQTGFNLVLCYFALGDRERQRRGFAKLLSVRQLTADAESLETMNQADVSEDDGAKQALRERIRASHRYVSLAAKLLAASIEQHDAVAGFDWVIETLKAAGQAELATEVQIAKANHFMRERKFDKAVETLKSYERQDPALVPHAATNLSFIYFHEGDFANAAKCAPLRYSALHAARIGTAIRVPSGTQTSR